MGTGSAALGEGCAGDEGLVGEGEEGPPGVVGLPGVPGAPGPLAVLPQADRASTRGRKATRVGEVSKDLALMPGAWPPTMESINQKVKGSRLQHPP